MNLLKVFLQIIVAFSRAVMESDFHTNVQPTERSDTKAFPTWSLPISAKHGLGRISVLLHVIAFNVSSGWIIHSSTAKYPNIGFRQFKANYTDHYRG